MLLCKIPPGGQQPRVLVLVLGHLGCTHTQLLSYMELFTTTTTSKSTRTTSTTVGSQSPPPLTIAVGVIGTVSPVKNFIFHQSLRARAIEVLQKTIH